MLVGVILTGVIVLKPNKEVRLDNVILKQDVNNKTFAMYTETDNGYEEYNGNSFPKGQRLNKSLSKCIDKSGEEIKNAISVDNENGNIGIKSNKSLSCYLYFDNKIEDLSGNGHNGTNHAQLWTEEGLTTSIDSNNLGYVDCGLANHDFKDSITMITRLKFSDLAYGQAFLTNAESAGADLSVHDNVITFHVVINNDDYTDVKIEYDINLETYYTIIGVYDGKKMSLYINGNEISSSKEISGNIKQSSMPILLGANPNPGGNNYYSYTTFTDALIFDSALTEDEIQKYFSGTIVKEQVLSEYVNKYSDNKSEQKLLLYYKFDE